MVATYLHGPCLARNPELADLLLSRVVGELPPLELPEVEQLRRERLAARGGSRSGRRRCRGDGRRRGVHRYVAGRQRRACGRLGRCRVGCRYRTGTGRRRVQGHVAGRQRRVRRAPPMEPGRWPAAARSARCSPAAAAAADPHRGGPGATSAGEASAPIGSSLCAACQRSRRVPSGPDDCPEPYCGFWISGTVRVPTGGGGAGATDRLPEPITNWPGAGAAAAAAGSPWITVSVGVGGVPGWARSGRAPPGRHTPPDRRRPVRHPRPARRRRAIRFRRLIASTLLPSRAMRRSLPARRPG